MYENHAQHYSFLLAAESSDVVRRSGYCPRFGSRGKHGVLQGDGRPTVSGT